MTVLASCGKTKSEYHKEYELLKAMYEEAKNLIDDEPVPSKAELWIADALRLAMAQKYVDPGYRLEGGERRTKISEFLEEKE